MKLKVPLVLQEGMSDCGQACIAMIMHFYGSEMSIERVKDDLGKSSKGTYISTLGKYLLSKNFDVELVTFCPDTLVKSELPMDPREYLGRLKRNPYCADKYKRLKDFSKKGGVITLDIPTLEDIAMEIEAGRPLIVGLTNNFALGNTPWLNDHYNVVTGIDDAFVYVNDPSYSKTRYIRNDFLYGLYAQISHNTSDILKIKRGNSK